MEKIGLVAIFDTSDFNKGLADYIGGTKQATEATDKFQQEGFSLARSLETAVGIALEKVGEAIIGVAGDIAELGSESVDLASQFESSMVTLKTAASDSALSIEQLSDITMKVGSDSNVLGASATSVAEAMTNLYRAGLKDNAVFGDMQGYLAGTAELGGVLKASFDLAAGSELDVAQASELGVVALSVYGGALEDDAAKGEFAAKALDNLVRTANASNASVPDLAEALKYAGVSTSQFGMSLEDTDIALGLLSIAGIKGSMAGTTLTAVLGDLTKGTKESEAALKEMGVEIYDTTTGKARPFVEIIADMQDALIGKTQAEKDAYLQDIFTAQGLRGINVLLSEGTSGWTEMEGAVESATGLQAAAAASADTYAGQLEALDGQVETLKIQFGTALLPILTEFLSNISKLAEQYGPQAIATIENLVAAISPFVNWLSQAVFQGNLTNDWLSSLPGPIQNVIKEFDSFMKTVGGLTGLFQTIQNTVFVQTIIQKVTELVTTVTPYVTEFVNELITIFTSLYDNASFIFAGLGVVILGAIDIVTGIIDAAIALWEGDWQGLGNALLEIATGAWELISGAIIAAFALIASILGVNVNDIITTLTQLWAIVQYSTETIWNGLTQFFATVWGNIKTTFNTVMTAINTFLFNTWTSISTTVTNTWNIILAFFNQIWEAVKLVFTVALGYILAVITGDTEAADAIITTVWNNISTFLSTIWETIKTNATLAWENLKLAITTKVEETKTIITQKWESINATIKQKIEALKVSAGQLFNDIKNIIANKIEEMKVAVSNGWNRIKQTFVDKFTEIKDYLLSIDLGYMGKALIEGLARGIITNSQVVVDAIKDAVKKAIAAALNALGIASPSKVFAEIGVNTMLGMAEGIQAGAVAPNTAMMNSVNNLISVPGNVTNIDNTRNINLSIQNNGTNGNDRTYFDVIAGLQAVGV